MRAFGAPVNSKMNAPSRGQAASFFDRNSVGHQRSPGSAGGKFRPVVSAAGRGATCRRSRPSVNFKELFAGNAAAAGLL
jgi:hypothetical protein